MERKNGLFIVAEGGEGSGKTTILQYIHGRLVRIFGEKRVVLTREPGGTPLADEIRTLLLHSTEKPSVRTELLLFCASRAEHCDKLIRPALEAGKILLSDRFDGSTLAYQIYGRERAAYGGIFEEINAFARGRGFTKEIVPDLVLFFDVDVEIGLARVRSRPEKQSNFDKEAVGFHRRVRDGFIYQCENKQNWVRIDANLDLPTVRLLSWGAVASFLAGKYDFGKEGVLDDENRAV